MKDGSAKDYAACLEEGGVAILLFHGVIRRQRHNVRNYTSKHITADRFAGILESLMTVGTPVSVEQILAAFVEGGGLPPRAFAVTFDDGFENNFIVAAPMLHKMRVPAAFYVTTGFVDSGGPSWTDMIEYALERIDSCRLELHHPGLEGEWRSAEEKIALMECIRQVVKGDRGIEPYGFAREVWRQLGIHEMEPDPELDRKLCWDQLREMSRNPLFTVGGHGHTHRILSYLNSRELEEEVCRSVGSLRAHLDADVHHYSYPEGLSHCYSDAVITVLRHHGIRCALTADEGTNRPGDDPFRLKRVWVT